MLRDEAVQKREGYKVVLHGVYRVGRFPYDHTWRNRHHGKNIYIGIFYWLGGAAWALLHLNRRGMFLGHLLGRSLEGWVCDLFPTINFNFFSR